MSKTKPTAHEIAMTKHKRYPLEPHFAVSCTCGFSEPPTDIEQARTHRNRHEGQIKRGEV